MFLNCKGSTGKSLADHLLKDGSWLEKDVHPTRRGHTWAFTVIG